MRKSIAFGSNLKYYRTKKGLTQKELAEEIGYTEKSVSKWEKGKGLPTAEMLIRLSELFEFLGAKDNLYWYFRDGKHRHSVEDVEMLVNLIEHKFRGAPLSEKFFRKPFDEKELIFKSRKATEKSC